MAQSGSGYPDTEGLLVQDRDGQIRRARYIRGLSTTQTGGPDAAVDGDRIVSLHVDTWPMFAEEFAGRAELDDPVIRFDGVISPQPNGFIEVCVLTRPRASLASDTPIDLVIAGAMAPEELEDWPLFQRHPCEVQVTLDPSARHTRRTTIQFSWALADAAEERAGRG